MSPASLGEAARGDGRATSAPIPTIAKRLAGVVVDTTAISKVVPETNSLTS
ncbi:hypothetical protein [Nocardia jiangxiensis]|uniref:FXSXX-COOH protein n=1 Tax=Nocardia jiangxiensis TaxID=282685 RepID=A0ABW6SE15_9NOCA|nr:hypothetical protein [Nocardia jiangxiensis]